MTEKGIGSSLFGIQVTCHWAPLGLPQPRSSPTLLRRPLRPRVWQRRPLRSLASILLYPMRPVPARMGAQWDSKVPANPPQSRFATRRPAPFQRPIKMQSQESRVPVVTLQPANRKVCEKGLETPMLPDAQAVRPEMVFQGKAAGTRDNRGRTAAVKAMAKVTKERAAMTLSDDGLHRR